MRISDWSSDVCSSDLLHPASDVEVRGIGIIDLIGQVERLALLGQQISLPRLPRQADEQQREAQARQRPPLPPPGRHPPSSPAYRRKSAKSTCWSFGEAQLSLLQIGRAHV